MGLFFNNFGPVHVVISGDFKKRYLWESFLRKGCMVEILFGVWLFIYERFFFLDERRFYFSMTINAIKIWNFCFGIYSYKCICIYYCGQIFANRKGFQCRIFILSFHVFFPLNINRFNCLNWKKINKSSGKHLIFNLF